MDILTLHIIAIGCIVYLAYRYGIYSEKKRLEKFINEMALLQEELKKKPDPFFTRR